MPDLNQILQGQGSPEGVVAAQPGQRYNDFLNNNLWIKEQGDGPAGWKNVNDIGGGGGAAGLGDRCMIRGVATGAITDELIPAIHQNPGSEQTSVFGTSLSYNPAFNLFGTPTAVIVANVAGVYMAFIRVQQRITAGFTGPDYFTDYFNDSWKDPTSAIPNIPQEEKYESAADQPWFYHHIPASGGAEKTYAYESTLPPAFIPAGAVFNPTVERVTGQQIFSAYVKVVRLA